VSPIGGVYYSSTPTALHIPEQQQLQQQQGRAQQIMSAPTSPVAGSSGSPMRRPTPSKVRKPVFGVKGAYSSMAARRYAAALAASGHADPDVLAEAIQAAAAEAEGSRVSQLAPSAAAAAAAGAAGAGTSRASPAALRGFGSGPVPQNAPAAASSSSGAAVPSASSMAVQSRQVASLVSPRMMGAAASADPLQPAHPPGAGVDFNGRLVSGQQMSPKTPAADSRPQGAALNPLNPLDNVSQSSAAAPYTSQLRAATEPVASPGASGSVWHQETSQWGASAQPSRLSQDDSSSSRAVPVAQGVVGTQMRAAARVSTSSGLQAEPSGEFRGPEAEIYPQQQQQQQRMTAATAMAASHGLASFRINPSLTSSMSADMSRSPSPPYRSRTATSSGITAAAAAAAAAAVAAGGIASGAVPPEERSRRWSPGRVSPTRSASPARPPAASPSGRHGQMPTLITLEGASGGSTTGTDDSSSLVAAQRRSQALQQRR
jgi:hypothetical protein